MSVQQMKRRRAPNLTERNAACLLMLKRGDGWLIPEPLRSTGTAKEIVAAVQWDHAHLHAMGGCTRPQNITPMLIADHKEKSKKDNGVAAKSKRLIAKEQEFRQRLLAKDGDEIRRETKKSQAPKAKIRSAPFMSAEKRRELKERYGAERRS